ncbi:hypothetical protein MIR68_011940 [Amoeboaphelidium protococcarum]|nr:hypothetical protein MIR68_011940 [Amoeboaphelidium protococcarum]KAI3648133.1 hypothetical protein MP228_005987 [Amoeboaphelidium protococcarum]KAI3649771.1 hypothetical protein MP228_005403 [Amoeboaphelidium protococcarum]
MSEKLKAYELRSKTKEELMKQLEDLKREINTLRVQKASSNNNQKSTAISVVRKNIARVLTVITQKQREALKEEYKGKKYLPLDMRFKKTRALRRALTKEQLNKKTEKEMKKLRQYPVRKYAVLA